MKCSPQGIAFITEFEGFRAMPYQDGGGIYTIGYGTQIPNSGIYPTGISKENAMSLLSHTVDGIASRLTNLGFKDMYPWAADALISFVYNIGFDAFRKSNACSLLLGDNWQALGFWSKWVHDAKGNIEEGLLKRREAEIKLFVFGKYS